MPNTIVSDIDGLLEPLGSDGQVIVSAGVTVDGSIAPLLGVALGFGLESLVPASLIINDGTIKSDGLSSGVDLVLGGRVANGANGAIRGGTDGITIATGGGHVTNAGTVTAATGAGVNLVGGGIVENAGMIASTGLFGSGLLGGVAVNLGGAGGNRLILDAGQTLSGVAQASGSNNTLELAAGLAGSLNTVADIGVGIKGFGSVQVDSGVAAVIGQITQPEAVTLGAGAALALTGSVVSGVTIDLGAGLSTLSLLDPGRFSGQIVGFGIGDVLDIGGTGAVAAVSYDPAAHAIDVRSAAGTSVVPVTFDASIDPTSLVLTSSALAGGGTQVSVGSSLDGSSSFVNPLGSNLVGAVDGHDLSALGAAVVNAGSIVGQGGSALTFTGGGSLLNSGALAGLSGGVTVSGGPGAVTNAPGGSVTASGAGGVGIALLGGGIVVNAGTIGGTDGSGTVGAPGAIAVALGAGNSKLTLDAGQVLNGGAAAAGSGNTLELALGTGTSANTIADLGSTITGFGTVLVDAGVAASVTNGIAGAAAVTLGDGASLTVGGPVGADATIDLGGNGTTLTLTDPAGFMGKIVNLGPDDKIDLSGLGSLATVSYDPNAGAIDVTTGGGIVSSVIPVSLAAGLDPLAVGLTSTSDGANGVDLTVSLGGGGTGGTGGTGTGGTGTGGTGGSGSGGTGTGGTGTGTGGTGTGGTRTGGTGTGGTGTGGTGTGTGTGTGGTGTGGTGTGSTGTGGTGGTGVTPPSIGSGSGDTGTGSSSGTGANLPIPPTIGGTPTGTSTPTVTGVGAPGSTVTLYDTDGKTVLGSATADPSTGAYGITSSPLADGLHSLTVTDTVGGATSAPSSPILLDIDTQGPQLAFDPTIGWAHLMKATLTGTVADPSGVASVEVYAGGRDVGSANVNTDGTWNIVYRGGRIHTRDIYAVAVDGAGNQSSAASNYEIKAGIGGQPYTGVLDSFDPATGAFIGETFYKRNGDVVYQNTVQSGPQGQIVYTYQNGDFFLSKNYSSFRDIYSADGAILREVQNNDDGSHTVLGQASGQVISALHNDTITGGGDKEQFVFRPKSGQELITDFQAGGQGHDVLNLVGTQLHSLADVLRATTMSGSDAVIEVNQQTSITLAGVSVADLKAHPADFKFHA